MSSSMKWVANRGLRGGTRVTLSENLEKKVFKCKQSEKYLN